MKKEKNKHKSDTLPESFGTLSEAANFWDSHDSADYEDMMEDVEFEVNIKRHVYLVPIAENTIDSLRKKARAQGLSTETLVNLLLQNTLRKKEQDTNGDSEF